ncbi:MAG TPA: LptA/OstA family protein [Terracidiphilus sp.]|nr:LptA/OstA family protein [Terracidiphilus sp.]
MRLTIERLRTLVLGSGVLLIVALVALLAIGKWRNPFSKRDIPKRLGIDIQQEANGFTYSQSHGGRTIFRIHASKVVQLKKGQALLHDVRIELFGDNGNRVDRIEGNEFEYDQQAGIARATGQVEITLTHAGQAMALASSVASEHPEPGDRATNKLATAARNAARGDVRVKTSGLTFNQKSGVASTSQRVEFALNQGQGSAIGASFDSQQGLLVMQSAVDLHFMRGTDPVHVTAQHAEYERDNQIVRLAGATADFHGGEVKAQLAAVQLRGDGSAENLKASDGFSLKASDGDTLSAPRATMQFDAHNRPLAGRLEDGVQFASQQKDRSVRGTSPLMLLSFSKAGVLTGAHLERGVYLHSEESTNGRNAAHIQRDWQSPVVELMFHDEGNGHIDLASMQGTGGVTVNGETQRCSETLPSHFAADQVTATFGPSSSLTSLIGVGNATMEQTADNGARQSTSGERIEAEFLRAGSRVAPRNASQIQSAKVEGHVVIVQTPAQGIKSPSQTTLRATADRADYEGAGQRLHLTGNPRVENAGLELSADRIDLSQTSGNALAEGNVKATWQRDVLTAETSTRAVAPNRGNVAFGGDTPAHAVANQVEINQRDGVATLHGGARLWQGADSVSAPVIVLNRQKQTLDAQTSSISNPVRVVLLSTASSENRALPAKANSSPTVIRLTGGALKYSAAERKAWMHGGLLKFVQAETADATTRARDAELDLLPPGNHAGKNGSEALVDRLMLRGAITVNSRGREGMGEQLVYMGESGRFVLTGTSSNPPRIVDPNRGSVTGDTLIFNSADDSVSIEGGTRKTTTETVTPPAKHAHD